MDGNIWTMLMEQVQQLFNSNQLVGAIASGGLVVWVISNLKNIYYNIRNLLISIFSFSINNITEDVGHEDSARQTAFEQIISESKPIWDRIVNFNPKRCNGFTKTTYGSSIRLIYGKLCFVSRYYQMSATKNNIKTTIRVCFAFKKNFIKKLESDITERVKERNNADNIRSNIYIYRSGSSFSKSKRYINSIFTNNSKTNQALDDILKFIKNKEIYERLNYPYKYSCCFYGKPGCGKTSMIHTIASELNRDIVYVDIANNSTQDLIDTILSFDQNRVIYVFEDIDAVCTNINKNREKTTIIPSEAVFEDGPDNVASMKSTNNSSCISLSDLLNITDGLLSTTGSICIFTTNHIDKLDPALLRSGRMNNLVEFEEMNKDTANEMISHYLGRSYDNLKDNIKPSDLQESILNVMVGKITCDELFHRFDKDNH